jgi:hypothetical protein
MLNGIHGAPFVVAGAVNKLVDRKTGRIFRRDFTGFGLARKLKNGEGRISFDTNWLKIQGVTKFCYQILFLSLP